jgi:hypothetical protein
MLKIKEWLEEQKQYQQYEFIKDSDGNKHARRFLDGMLMREEYGYFVYINGENRIVVLNKFMSNKIDINITVIEEGVGVIETITCEMNYIQFFENSLQVSASHLNLKIRNAQS